jgi:hypothetical protein
MLLRQEESGPTPNLYSRVMPQAVQTWYSVLPRLRGQLGLCVCIMALYARVLFPDCAPPGFRGRKL